PLNRVSFGVARKLRSGVSGIAGRGPGHGDARPSEIFCAGRRERQAIAPFSGRAEYRWRSGRNDLPWARTGPSGAFQRCAFLLADGSKTSAARADRLAAQCDLPERSRQLLRESTTRTTLVQLDFRDSAAQRHAGAAR